MAPYHLTDDLEELRRGLLKHEDRPSGNRLGVGWEGAVDEFLAFAICYDLSDPQLSHKCSHTLRVASNACEIARHASSGDLYPEGHPQRRALPVGWVPDGGACLLLGLLHDVGRFPQYAMHRTYSDTRSISHAELSYRMLRDFGMASRFVNLADGDSDGHGLLGMVLHAVRIHSDLSLGDVSGPGRAYADILRDADKVDILEEYCHAVSAGDFAKQVSQVADALRDGTRMPSVDPIDAPTIHAMARLSGRSLSVSEPVMGDVMAGGLVDRTKVTTAGDAIIMTVSLFAGIETGPARDMLVARGTMSRIRDAVTERYGRLDGTGTLGQAMGRVTG